MTDPLHEVEALLAKITPGEWTLGPCSHGGLLLKRGEAFGPVSHQQHSLQIVPAADAEFIAAAPRLLRALSADLQRLREEIDAAWFGIEHSYDIEDRAYFEREAPRNGFKYALAQAVHHIHKRDPKVEAAESQVQQLQEENASLTADLQSHRERIAALNVEIERLTAERATPPANHECERGEASQRICHDCLADLKEAALQSLNADILANPELCRMLGIVAGLRQETAERAVGQAHQEENKEQDDAGLPR